MKKIAFIDLEIDGKGKILDIGAIKTDSMHDSSFHSSSIGEFNNFIIDCDYLCGHNIVEHDCKYLEPFLKKDYIIIDTLHLSPILFPEKPYHKLVKDDKLLSEELNNPLNDSRKAKSLFEDELAAFDRLPDNTRKIYAELLGKDRHFQGFLHYVGITPTRFPLFSRLRQDRMT